MATKPEDLTWKQYVARLEQEIRNRPNQEGFLISSTTRNGDTIQYRPISELREELNLARLNAASESLGASSPFLSDCAL